MVECLVRNSCKRAVGVVYLVRERYEEPTEEASERFIGIGTGIQQLNIKPLMQVDTGINSVSPH